MWWSDEDDAAEQVEEEEEQNYSSPFGFLSLFSRPKDYYKILEVDYDATEEAIRSNYIRLALKWHPDKKKEEVATSRFQEIYEAYMVLCNPTKRRQYDRKRFCGIQDYNATEFPHRYKGLILTCNGLGMGYPAWYNGYA